MVVVTNSCSSRYQITKKLSLKRRKLFARYGLVYVLRIGVSDLHHGSGTVGAAAGPAVAGSDAGIAAEDMGPAVLTAEDGPFAEYSQTVQRCGAAVAHSGISQDLIVEGDVDTVVVPVKGHRLHLNVRMQQLRAADLCPGGRVQDLLGPGG